MYFCGTEQGGVVLLWKGQEVVCASVVENMGVALACRNKVVSNQW